MLFHQSLSKRQVLHMLCYHALGITNIRRRSQMIAVVPIGIKFFNIVDETATPTFDKKMVGRIKSIQLLDEENKSHVFAMLDAFLLKCNIQNNLTAK